MKDDYYRQVYRVKGLYFSCDGKKIKREYENKDMFLEVFIYLLL